MLHTIKSPLSHLSKSPMSQSMKSPSSYSLKSPISATMKKYGLETFDTPRKINRAKTPTSSKSKISVKRIKCLSGLPYIKEMTGKLSLY